MKKYTVESLELTGVDEIDAQRKNLVNLSMDFLEGRSPVGVALDNLTNSATEHFAHEEKFLRAIRYPYTQEHVEAQRRFINKLKNMTSDLKANQDNTKRTEQKLITTVEDWISQHAMDADSHYVSYIPKYQEYN